nr:RNA-directed DNA polymerase, eukaryota [Tanacetum cinerariifolium]
MGFRNKWIKWVDTCLRSSSISILVNESPLEEFGLKSGVRQGDPLSPILFILAAKGLNAIVSEAVEKGIFRGVAVGKNKVMEKKLGQMGFSSCIIWGEGLNIGSLRAKNMALLSKWALGEGTPGEGVGVWRDIMKIGKQLIGWGYSSLPIGDLVKEIRGRVSKELAELLGVLQNVVIHNDFSRAANDGVFKGLQIQGSLSLSHIFYEDDAVFIGAWLDDNLDNLIKILNCFHLASSLKINVNKSQVLGVGVYPDIVNQGALRIGCSVMHLPLTLLKSVLGAVPIYNMSIYKASKGVLHEMKMLRNKFFNGTDVSESKITWFTWDKVLASKKKGGLGVSSFFALNRALLLKWVRDGSERQQWLDLVSMLDAVSLSSSSDRWYCDFNGDGAFRVKEVRSNLDDLFLPSLDVVTRWVRYVPIKTNVFTWRARLGRLPTRGNLINRGVSLDSPLCPICGLMLEDSQHLFFRCDMTKCIFQRICRWWNLQWVDAQSFDDWLSWFKSVRMPGASSSLTILFRLLLIVVSIDLPETRYVDPTGASSHTARTGSAATERAKVEHYIRLLHEPLRREEALALLNKLATKDNLGEVSLERSQVRVYNGLSGAEINRSMSE